MDNAAIRIRGLSKAFGARRALDKVSLELPEGAFLAIFGPNGAGKTTLLRLMATLAKPTEGTIELFGADTRKDADEARASIGLISHSSLVYPDLTAQENLELFGRLYGVADPTARALELLDAVGLRSRRHDVARTFSRGMTQRLSIARALVNDPRLVLLDEPYSGLDPHAAAIFDELLAAIRQGHTFCMVSHDPAKGLALCTHALILAKGKTMLFGAKEELGEEAILAAYRECVGTGVS